MNDNHYNVFLSYRRDPGRDFARTLQQAFRSCGFSVFFDFDSLRDGKFNEAIYSAIESCDVFVVVYSEGSLDRCSDEGDWVRMEIEHAFLHDRKVVCVAPTETYVHLSFPDDLPDSLARLRDIQTTEIHTGKYFDDSIKHCVEERFPDELKRKKEREDRRRARNERRDQRKAARTERKNQRREKRARRRAGKETQARSEDANGQ